MAVLTRRSFLVLAGAGLYCVGSGGVSALEKGGSTTKANLIVKPAHEMERNGFPKGVLQIDYRSAVDGSDDWALALPHKDAETWVVVLHGHGSSGDQLYMRPDMRDGWLPMFLRSGVGILTPNLRGNAWMSPAASEDLHKLLGYIRSRHGAKRFIFASGSMGGTSNLIYACLHPEDVSGVVALCPATDLTTYYSWCRKSNTGVLKEIADAIEKAYGGDPKKLPISYMTHSCLKNALKLKMPVYVVHGTNDDIIPVSQSRRLAGEMGDLKSFAYIEIPDGGHDSPLSMCGSGFNWIMNRSDK